MARIVLISPYLKGGQNAAKLAQRTRYVATRPGVELLADERSTLPATKKQRDFITRLLKSFPSCWELIEYEEYLDHPTQGSASAFIQQVREDYMEALDQKENFIDYISHRPGVQKDGEHGLWDAHGKVQNLAQAVREVAEHTGNVWTPVIALRREDAERLGYDSAENWQALVNASVCDIAAAYKIQPDNLRWYAAFHQKPNQVHIHMILFSADPREGYLTKEGIRQVKSVFARRIYHADRMHIYQQKDIARQELQMWTRKAMVECITQLKHGAVDNPRLEQLTEELAERLLTVKGRKVYGYLPPRVKAIVDAIVEEAGEGRAGVRRIRNMADALRAGVPGLRSAAAQASAALPAKGVPERPQYGHSGNTAMDGGAAEVCGCTENFCHIGGIHFAREFRGGHKSQSRIHSTSRSRADQI